MSSSFPLVNRARSWMGLWFAQNNKPSAFSLWKAVIPVNTVINYQTIQQKSELLPTQSDHLLWTMGEVVAWNMMMPNTLRRGYYNNGFNNQEFQEYAVEFVAEIRAQPQEKFKLLVSLQQESLHYIIRNQNDEFMSGEIPLPQIGYSREQLETSLAQDENVPIIHTKILGITTQKGHTPAMQNQYFQRLEFNQHLLKQTCMSLPEVQVVALQESPPAKNTQQLQRFTLFSQPSKQLLLDDNTVWGVRTVIYKHRGIASAELDQSISDQADATLPNIGDRVRTFKLTMSVSNQVKYFSNLHLPHGNPLAAFEVLFTEVLKKMVHDATKYKQPQAHDLAGDWNINPHDLQKIIDKVITELKVTALPPFKLDINYYSSPKGHLTASGKKISVDGLLRLQIESSKEYSYTFNSEPLLTGLTYLTPAIITGASLMWSERNTTEGDKKELEQESLLSHSLHF